jgi:hypothetical protein
MIDEEQKMLTKVEREVVSDQRGDGVIDGPVFAVDVDVRSIAVADNG